MKKALTYFAAFALVLTPAIASAQFGSIDTFVENIIDFINSTLIPLVFAVALLVFIWGMFTFFILGGGDEGKREQGKSLMFWAIIGFVMMVVILAIVNLISDGILTGTGGESNNSIDSLPQANPTS